MTLDVKYLGVGLGCVLGLGLGLTTKPIVESSSSVGLSATIQTVQTFGFIASFGLLGMLGDLAFEHLKSTSALGAIYDLGRVGAVGLASLCCSKYLLQKVMKDSTAILIISSGIATVAAYNAL